MFCGLFSSLEYLFEVNEYVSIRPFSEESIVTVNWRFNGNIPLEAVL